MGAATVVVATGARVVGGDGSGALGAAVAGGNGGASVSFSCPVATLPCPPLYFLGSLTELTIRSGLRFTTAHSFATGRRGCTVGGSRSCCIGVQR
jgi:hypothetical protein